MKGIFGNGRGFRESKIGLILVFDYNPGGCRERKVVLERESIGFPTGFLLMTKGRRISM